MLIERAGSSPAAGIFTLGAFWILLKCGLLGSKHGYYDPFNIVEKITGITNMLRTMGLLEAQVELAAA